MTIAGAAPARSFEAVSRLDDAALEVLLRGEDATARVWAVWVLGLRRGGTDAALTSRLAREPSPGVRRALCVVLAGHGHVDLVIAMARHDPAGEVRAAATTHLMRLARAGRVDWGVLAERLGDDGTVRMALLQELGPEAPPALREAAVTNLDDVDAAVRAEAFDAATRLHAAGLVAGGVLAGWLDAAGPELAQPRRWDEAEPSIIAERRFALLRWLVAGPVAAVAEVLATCSLEVRELALRTRPDLATTALAPLAHTDAALFDRVATTLGLTLAAAPTVLVEQLAIRWLEALEASDAGIAGAGAGLLDRLDARLARLDTVMDAAPGDDEDEEVAVGIELAVVAGRRLMLELRRRG